MKKGTPLLTSPALWLALQALLVGAFVFISGGFTLRITNDSGAYLNYFLPSDGAIPFLQAIFSHYRTFGYPLFLKIVSLFDPTYHSLPLIQYFVYVAAVFVFWQALTNYGFTKWTAFAAAAPLLYNRIILRYTSDVMSDSLAIAGVLIVFAILFRLAAAPGKQILWAGLALSLFLVCQVRPIYLFLLLLIPVLGALLVLYRRKAGTIKFISRCLAATFIPFFLFCSLRAVTVGQFGYTTYSGITLGGVVVPLLIEELVPKLSEDVQPLARRMIEKRKRGVSRGVDGHEIHWEGIEGPRVRWSDHRRWLYANPDYVGGIAVASAQELYGGKKAPGGWFMIDRKLKTLALELIKLRPLVYAQLVFLSIQKCLMETINTNLLLQFSFLLFILSRLGRVWVLDQERTCGKRADVILMLGFLFFFTKIFVVSLVQTPQTRYYLAAEIFLASIFAVAAVAPWEQIQLAAIRGIIRDKNRS